jgi:hypothetical protein
MWFCWARTRTSFSLLLGVCSDKSRTVALAGYSWSELLEGHHRLIEKKNQSGRVRLRWAQTVTCFFTSFGPSSDMLRSAAPAAYAWLSPQERPTRTSRKKNRTDRTWFECAQPFLKYCEPKTDLNPKREGGGLWLLPTWARKRSPVPNSGSKFGPNQPWEGWAARIRYRIQETI